MRIAKNYILVSAVTLLLVAPIHTAKQDLEDMLLSYNKYWACQKKCSHKDFRKDSCYIDCSEDYIRDLDYMMSFFS